MVSYIEKMGEANLGEKQKNDPETAMGSRIGSNWNFFYNWWD